MLSTELIHKIKRIEITARRLANRNFAGEYHSVFRGQGMEFDEIRPYVPGDDIRRIDWNVTARMAALHVRQFQEERELTVMLAVDASGSSEFGTIGRFKRELAAELAAVLSFAATINHDRVGLLIFTDQVEFLVPPRKGRRHALRMVRDLLVFEPKGKGTAINVALDTINLLLKRRGIVFLISDFLADPESFRHPLAATNQRHDLVAVDLHDPIERNIPDVGLIALEDAETGELDWVDTGSESWREEYETRMDNLEEEKRRMLASQGIDRIEVNTEKDYVPGLNRFFSWRTRRMSR
jgi:uncharacterized protein (DUF58 family)